MERWKKRKPQKYTIDLTKIDGDGSFPCPKCGTLINPEDESEEHYEIIGSKVKDDKLSEMILRCKKCKSEIRLIGFDKIDLDIGSDKP